MNTTIITATPDQRDRASQIWADLEDWHFASPLSDVDYYAVWGLAFAILNTPNRPNAYAGWLVKLEEIWADVRARYINAWN